jgi:hypothetical protein
MRRHHSSNLMDFLADKGYMSRHVCNVECSNELLQKSVAIDALVEAVKHKDPPKTFYILLECVF